MKLRLATGLAVTALSLGASCSVAMADTNADSQSQNQSQVQMQTQTQIQNQSQDHTSVQTAQENVAQNDSIADYVNNYNQKVDDGWDYNRGTSQWSGSTYNPTEEELNQPITATDPRFVAYQSNGSNNWTAVKDYLTADSSNNVDQTWYKATPDDSANYQVNVYDRYGNFLYTHKFNNLNNQIVNDSNPTTADKQNSFERFMEQPDVNKRLAYTQSYLGNGWYQYDGYESNNAKYMSHLIKSYQYNPQYNLFKLYYSTENPRKYETTQKDQPNNSLTRVSNNSASSELQLTTLDTKGVANKPSISPVSTVSLSSTKSDGASSATNTTTDHTKSESSDHADHLPQTGNDYSTNDVIIIGMILLATVLIIIFGI